MTNTAFNINHISKFFALIMLANIAYFLYWGLGYTDGQSPLFFFVAALFGLFMAFNIGGNDVANSFGTSVGAKTLTITQALCIAAIFEISGAVLAGGEVTSTIRSGIVSIDSFHHAIQPMQFAGVMMSALIAAAFWLLFATKRGLPVSTTHSIIGGIVGAACMLAFELDGVSIIDIVQWQKIVEIAMSWIISPVLGGLAAFLLYSFIKRFILHFNERAEKHLRKLKEERERLGHSAAYLVSELQLSAYTRAKKKERKKRQIDKIDNREVNFNTHAALQLWTPLIAAIGAMVMTSMLIFKGLKNLNLNMSPVMSTTIIILIGIAAWFIVSISTKRLRDTTIERSTFLIFSWMQVLTACGFAFSHGSNDIANAVGPFAAILDTIKFQTINNQAAVPTIVMIAFGIALIAGLWFIGKNVIATVGTNLTKMHPASGFTAELSAASVVMLASILGLPVSSTHILVGAVLGVGLVNGNANWRLMKPIGLAWVITVPVAAAIAALAYLIIQCFI